MKYGYQCSGCKNKDFWGIGCDLPCPKDKCPHGCDFIGNCLNPWAENCKHESKVFNPTAAHLVINPNDLCQGCKDGWWGPLCENSCMPDSGKHCLKGPEGTCTRMGSCYDCEA